MDFLTRALLFTAQPADNTPDPLSFPITSGVSRSELVTSAVARISGVTGPVEVRLSEGQYRINGGSWVRSGILTATEGDTIEIQTSASPAFDTQKSIRISVGTEATTWVVVTRTPDTQPVAFAFVDRSGVDPNVTILSGVLVIRGLEVDCPVTISCTNGLIDGGPRALSGKLEQSKTVYTTFDGSLVIEVQLQSSAAFNRSVGTQISVGTGSTIWSVTTRIAKTNPVPFPISDAIVDPSVVWRSGRITVAGLEPGYPILISGSNCTMDIGAQTLSGNFNSTSQTVTTSAFGTLEVEVKVNASDRFDTPIQVTLTIGDRTEMWTVKTRVSDTQPQTFVVPDIAGVELNTLITSDIVVVSGLEPNYPFDVSIDNGGIDVGKTSTDLSGVYNRVKSVISALDGSLAIRVQRNSSLTVSTIVQSTIAVGSGTSVWHVTTRPPKTVPLPFMFTDVVGAETSTQYINSVITISGLDANYEYTISATGDGTVSAGTTVISGNYSQTTRVFTDATGSFNVNARMVSPSSFEATKSTDIQIGTVTDNWSIQTRALKNTPAPFTFVNVDSAIRDTPYTSNVITVTGLEPNYEFIINASAGGLVNAGSTTLSSSFDTFKRVTASSAGTLVVALRQVSSIQELTTTSTVVTIGNVSSTWQVTTRLIDRISDTMTFTPITGAALDVLLNSEQVVVTGLEPNYEFVVSATGGLVDAAPTSIGLGSDPTSAVRVTTTSAGTLVVRLWGRTSKYNDVENTVSLTVGTNLATWTIQTKVSSATEVLALTVFGEQVGISGTTSIVGVYLDDNEKGINAGAAFIYIQGTDPLTAWDQQTKLMAPDGNSGDFFGGAVAISGNTVAVGACGNDADGGDAGAVYVYTRTGTTWGWEQKIAHVQTTVDSLFGAAIALHDNTIIIGALTESKAYVYTRMGTVWSLDGTLQSPSGAIDEWFGASVAIFGNIAVVGSPKSNLRASSGGAVSIFAKTSTGWQHIATDAPTSVTNGAQYGRSVTISGTQVLVGAPGLNSVYTIGWTLDQLPIFSDLNIIKSTDAGFGRSVSVTTDDVWWLAIGSDTGAAYLYNHPTGAWELVTKLTNAAESYGTSVAITGTPSVPSGMMVAVGGIVPTTIVAAPVNKLVTY